MSQPLQVLAQFTRQGVGGQSGNHISSPVDISSIVAPPLSSNCQPLSSSPGIQAAYFHVPFCFHKCHYCDFYSIVDSKERQEAFVDRMIQEIEAGRPFIEQPLESVFIGGGTPTLLRVDLLSRLLEAIGQLPHAAGCEFTVEANPETVSVELAASLRSGGVNRVSIGCQSFNPQHLRTLERWHDPANVRRSVETLRNAGIDNINLDLIFAIPGQTLDDWHDDLDQAIALVPTHLSCYNLTYEPNTPMTKNMLRGRITRADEDLEAQMYESTIHRLRVAGFAHYEISNWSRNCDVKLNGSDNRCKHNLAYWHNRNWWAFGPSASGHVNGVRWKNASRLSEYLSSRGLPPATDIEQVDEDAQIGERLMLSLRLIEGLRKQELDRLLQLGKRGKQRRLAIDRACDSGLLNCDGPNVRFTRKGLMLADSVLCELI